MRVSVRTLSLRAFLFLLVALSLATTAASAADRPNVVILLCDDMGYGDLACYGHPDVKSPHVDRLASEGLRLTSFYSAAPVCSPSRAGLMTGRIPQRLGVRDWIPANSGVFLRPSEVTIAELLKGAGYRTCHAGKWHLNSKTDGSEPTPGDAGFKHWLYTQNNAAPNHLGVTNFIRNGTHVGKLRGASSHVVVAEAIDFLEAHPGEPFFLNLWFHETHERVAAAERFLERYPDEANPDRRQYLADVTQLDAAVGKLMAYLDEYKLRDNTLVVFTSDNGPETLLRYPTGTRSFGLPGRLRGMKLHVTEGGCRVPAIVRWPGHVKAGSVSDEPACGVDLLPTICAIADIDLPKDRTLDGADLQPLFAGKPVDRPHALYWQYDAALGAPWTVALRSGPWKLLANATLDRFALYNLAEDLSEARDLAEQEPRRVEQMTAEMRRLHGEVAAEGARSGNPVNAPAH